MSLTVVVPILHFRFHCTTRRSALKAFKSFLMTSFVCSFYAFLIDGKSADEITHKHEGFSIIFCFLQRARPGWNSAQRWRQYLSNDTFFDAFCYDLLNMKSSFPTVVLLLGSEKKLRLKIYFGSRTKLDFQLKKIPLETCNQKLQKWIT